MITVKLSTNFPHWPLLRQTPASMGIWGDCQFLVNQDVSVCDWWVVYEGLMGIGKACCPKSRTILITAEPKSVKDYDPDFLRQFSTIVTSQSEIVHPRVLYQHTALPWHVGVNRDSETATLHFDDLRIIGTFPKSKLASVVCSSQTTTTGHRQRIRFIEKLKSRLGTDVDIYGRGFNPIADKWDAIAPYKYHIVLENSRYPHYWSEKIADAFLAYSFPIYYGAPNLGEYFPRRSFAPIDLTDPDAALATVESVIYDEVFERSLKHLASARDLVLTKYNLFAMLAELCSRETDSSSATWIELSPERPSFHAFPLLGRCTGPAKALLKQILPSSSLEAIRKCVRRFHIY
jgi:hypothetical protein